jgi:hypothetical protein
VVRPACSIEWLISQGRYGDAAAAGKESVKFAGRVPDRAFSDRAIKAIAARDYAFAVTRWSGASPEQRAEARQELDTCCTGLDERYSVLAGALIVWAPKADEVASIRRLLDLSPAAPPAGKTDSR